MLGKKLCEVLIELFEDNKDSPKSKEIADELAQFLGVNKVSIGLYEEGKNVFRIVTTNYFQMYEKIPIKLLGERESFSKIVLKGEEVCAYKLYNNSQSSLVGVVITDVVPEKIANFHELTVFLSYILWLIPSYEKSKRYLEKYRSLWLLTNIFESSQATEQLIEDFLMTISSIVDAEYVCLLKFNVLDDNNQIVNVKRYDALNDDLKDFSLPIDNLKLQKYFKGSDKILYKPYGMEDIIGTDKVLSALVISSEIGWFVLINKKDQKTYSVSKSFNSMELEIARDSVNRLILAISRIEFEQRLKEELEKLKKLQSSYEQLIEEQKEQIRKMNSVHYISQAIRSMYSVKNVYKTLLLGLTSGRLLGYNRALLLVYDDKKDVLVGKIWFGPESDNVEEDWKKANLRAMRYSDIVQYLREESMVLETDNKLTRNIEGRIFPYKGHPILQKSVIRRKIFISNDKIANTMGLDAADLINLLGTKEFAVIPLIGREEIYGVVIVDNYYTKKAIKDSDIEILKILSDSASLAIETALNYEELKTKTVSLERQKSLIEYLREFSESILQNMSSAIIVIDKEAKITEWNKKAEIYFGRPKEQMTGLELKTLGTEFEDIEEMAFQSMRIKDEITLSNYLIQVMTKERYYDIKITPFWDSEKLILRGVIITLDDVTDRVNLEKERKKQEKLAALGEMAARVAHELRNPISVLGGFIKRLERNINNPEAREKYVNILKNEILRLENIVNEILDFSREPRSLEFSEFSINKLINDVYILFEDKIIEKNILFTFKTDHEEMNVYGEYTRLKQVIINLLQNAIEATANNGEILIETKTKVESIVVSVWNEGTPIDKETSNKLFIPFFTTKVHGTGLGLAICKKIIEDEHKGKIYHEVVDDGNRFVIEIPKRK